MNAAEAKAAVYTDFRGLDKLRLDARNHAPGAADKVARQFESLFTEMIIKSMRKASMGNGIFDSQQMKFYRGMFDHQLALSMSSGRGIGIAAMLKRQLAGTQATGSTTPEVTATQATGTHSKNWNASATPAEFVQRILPYARHAATALGVNPKALIAQAALETNWGKSVIEQPDGTSSFNLFGIKAGDSSAPSVTKQSLEFRDGTMTPETSRFRSYASLKDCFDDYVRLLKTRGCYADTIGRGNDIDGFASALASGGYATDPQYAAKLGSIAHGHRLNAALKEIASAPTTRTGTR
jgi:flagellar protein FlgJ